MQRLALGLLVLGMFSFSVFGQKSAELKTVEFVSPITGDGTFSRTYPYRNCFSFIMETADCRSVSDLYYGNLRTGSDWDWLQVTGAGSRNKIKSLGRKEWTDEIKVPKLEPYPKLEPGQQRMVVIDTSGKDGIDGLPGAPGRNADGSFGSSVLDKPPPPAQTPREKIKSDYNPFEKAVLGNMYVLRVVDEKNDFYVLFRVDELESGRRCKISWKKIDAPKAD